MVRVEDLVPEDTPDEVKQRVITAPRVPSFDPTLGIPVPVQPQGVPAHRLVVIGDSLSHGFQSGAVYNTDLSYAAIIAYELGWLDGFRYPRYPGVGGIPLNLEFLLRYLDEHIGSEIKVWDPRVIYYVREFMDKVEDYWERGPGRTTPGITSVNHCLAVYGWDLRDALSRSASSSLAAIKQPSDDWVSQLVEGANHRAALRVYPTFSQNARDLTLFSSAASLGSEHDAATDHGIETLVVFLGANNALQTVTKLKVLWSKDPDADGGFKDLNAKNSYTVWTPTHFSAELADVVQKVERIEARHVIWCTVPHVTIAPIARGVGTKVTEGSRYYPYYTRPWISDNNFVPWRDPHITDRHARAVDCAIDMYNDVIEGVVLAARKGQGGVQRDWYLLDVAGLLDRLAARRYILDPLARPSWWEPYELPPALAALTPVPDSRFLSVDDHGNRAQGGLFSLDGVHPTTIGYGLIAQEMINIMVEAGVQFFHSNGTPRSTPIKVDFDRLIVRDSLIRRPPRSVGSSLEVLGWVDETVGWLARALNFSFGK